MRSWCWVLALVLMWTPLVSAQSTATPELTWQAPPEIGFVGFDPVTFEALLEVRCESPSVTTVAPWVVRILASVPDDPGLSWTWKPQQVAVSPEPTACATGELLASETITVEVSSPATAPAGTRVTIVLSASEDSMEAPVVSETSATVEPFMNHQATFAQAIWKVPPGETVSLPLEVSNFGNGAVRVTVAEAESSAKDLKPSWPDDMVVEPDKTGTFAIDVKTGGGNPLYENRRDDLRLRVSTAWVEDPTFEGEPREIVAVIQQQGTEVLPAPAPPVAWLLLGLVALGLARRRG